MSKGDFKLFSKTHDLSDKKQKSDIYMPKFLIFICILRVVAYFLRIRFKAGESSALRHCFWQPGIENKIFSLLAIKMRHMSCQSIKSVFREFPLVKIKQMVLSGTAISAEWQVPNKTPNFNAQEFVRRTNLSD